MNTNTDYERHRVIVSVPNERRENITQVIPNERRENVTEIIQEAPREVTLSPAVMLLIVLLAVLGAALTIYVVSNRNANDEANRQALLQVGQADKEPAAQAPVARPSVQPPPVVTQPPAPVQQAPVIIPPSAPPVQEKSSPLEDVAIQDAATKRLMDEADLSPVSVIVINGKATLIGVVNSEDLKMKAEKIVKSVRGVKSIENKITVSPSETNGQGANE